MSSFARYRRLRKLDGAQALEDQIAVLATQWVTDWRSHESVPDELAAVHKLTEAALARAAEAWNRQHHALRRLPREVFELCWSFLNTPDLLRVSSTCKVWRLLIHDAPALWTDVTFRGVGTPGLVWCAALGPILERSKGLLFGLSVNVRDSLVLREVVTLLQPHAHRLLRLEMRPEHGFLFYEPIPLAFSAPALRVFVFEVSNLSFQLDDPNFKISCPNLERMELRGLALDGQSPHLSFGCVTYLTFIWRGGSLNGLYDTFPSLASLDITFMGHVDRWHAPPVLDLPRDKPPPATLQHVSLRGLFLSYDDLLAFGFTSLRELEIEGAKDKFDDTLALFDALGGTSRSAATQGRRLVVRADGPRKLCITFDVPQYEQYYTILSRPSVCENIRTLSLPFEELPLALPQFKMHYLFPADEFPALETLVLPVGHPLLDLDNMPACGTLRAPALRRLAIIDSPCSADRALKPLFLAVFIARHLALPSGRILDELVLDGDHGVALCEREHEYDDGIDILKNHVSTISHKYHPQDA